MSDSLSTQLREVTSAAHQSAESSPFVEELMGGQLNFEAYVLYVAQLYPIYRSLEDACHNRFGDAPLLATINDRNLDREPALRADLTALVSDERCGWQAVEDIPVVAAVSKYEKVLDEAQDPELILAHHYVRYLGDLSGGLAIGRLVQRHYQVPSEALNFYRFDGIAKVKPYKDQYRELLDALELADSSRQLVLDYAVESFALNQQVFVDSYAELARLAS